jgi:hypothetical protein
VQGYLVGIAANNIFGGTTGGQQLEALTAEYQALAKETLSEMPTPAGALRRSGLSLTLKPSKRVR